jgi:lipopolysaccharide export system permease protein
MFRILDRYLVSEVFFPFMIMMIGAVVFGLTDLIYTLTDLFINSGVPLAVVVRLLLFKIPAVMVLYFPLVILFATLLVMVRMARESEITVLQAGGISSLRIVLGLILFGALATGVSYFLNETVVPMSNHVSDNLIRKAGLKKPPPEITQNVFFKASRNRYFYIRSISPSFKVMNDVMVYELTADFPRVITAKEAIWTDRSWELKNGTVHRFDEKGRIQFEAVFESMVINPEVDISAFYTEQKTAREMSSGELKKQIAQLRTSGVNTRTLDVDLAMKMSTPVACLIFALIGVALCLNFIQGHKDFWGIIVVIVVALTMSAFYIYLTAGFRSLGRGGFLDPFTAGWGPNLLYIAMGAGLMFKKVFSR